MNYIKSRTLYLEALKDVLSKKQIDQVRSVWGSKWLDYDRADVTNDIQLGKWEVSKEDKIKILDEFFTTDLNMIQNEFSLISEHFWTNLINSIKDMNPYITEGILNPISVDMKWDKPSYLQIAMLYTNAFKKISVGETKADELIIRDENGVPIKEDGKIVKRKKTEEELKTITFGNSLYNVISFSDDYDKVYGTNYYHTFWKSKISNLYSLFCDGITGEFDLYSEDKLYLSITDNPSDVLNMSVSKYFTSCQELYRGGGHGTQYMKGLLYNLFDPNTVPAFLFYDQPYISSGEELSDKVIISRLLIRNILDNDATSQGLYFDRGYPDRMRNILTEMIEKYSTNKNDATLKGKYSYLFTPDVDSNDFDDIKTPYHDNLSPVTKKLIGVNSKVLQLHPDTNYSKFIISPNNRLEKITIQTDKIPENMFLNIFKNLKVIKFNYMKISDIKLFNNIMPGKLEFHKCYFYPSLISDLSENLSELSIIGCFGINFDQIEKLNLTKLTIKFSDISQFEQILNLKSLKELEVSSSVMKKYKSIIDQMKIKVTIGGPNI